jgi:hypothetical protein
MASNERLVEARARMMSGVSVYGGQNAQGHQSEFKKRLPRG